MLHHSLFSKWNEQNKKSPKKIVLQSELREMFFFRFKLDKIGIQLISRVEIEVKWKWRSKKWMEPVENDEKPTKLLDSWKLWINSLILSTKFLINSTFAKKKTSIEKRRQFHKRFHFTIWKKKKNGVLTFVAENVIFRCHPFESTSRTNCISNRALPSKWSNVKNNENRNRLSLKTD